MTRSFSRRWWLCRLLAGTALIGTPALAQTSSAVAAGSAATPAQATAAAPEAAEAVSVGEVIVTAQKRSERLSDVPLSINAASGDVLKQKGVTEVRDLEKLVPGFTFAQSAYGAPIFTIRGIGFYDEALAIAPTVSVYVDQIPVPFSRMTRGATLDLERVEVLKGPQGTLFGQNSTGGAINYIAAKPTETLHYGGDLSYGRFNDVDVQGYVSGPLADGLTGRLALDYQRSDDWQKSITSNRTLGSKDFLNGRLLLDWRPTDTLKLELNVNGWRDRSESQALQYRKYSAITPTPLDGPNPAYTGFVGSAQQPTLDRDLRAYPVANGDRNADWDAGRPYRHDDTFWQVALRADYDITDRLTLTSISAYEDLVVHSPADIDGTAFLNLYDLTRGRLRTFSQEVRLSGSLDEDKRLQFMVGANYEHDDTEDNQELTFDGTNTGLFGGTPLEYRYAGSGLINRHYDKIETEAVFGSLDYKLTDTVTLQGSIRYNHDKREFAGCLADKGDGALAGGFGLLANVLHGVFTPPRPGDRAYIGPGGCVTLIGDPTSAAFNFPVPDLVRRDLPEHNVSWRVGASWKPVRGSMLYANITRGYKSGSFGTLPYLTDVQVQPIAQEKLTAYEVGFKSSLLHAHLDLTGAAFYYDYENKQLLGYLYTGAIFGNLPGEVSIPKSRVKGVEFSAVARPVTGLTVSGAATYINSRVTSDYRTASPDALYGFQAAIDPSCPAGSTVGSCGVNIRGSSFTYTPKWTLIGDVHYSFPLSEAWNGFVGANVNYRSSTFAAFAAPPDGTPRTLAYTTVSDYRLRGYTLVDLNAGVESPDGRYRLQVWGRNITDSYYWVHVVKIQDTLARVTGRPATVGVTLSARY